MILEATPTQKSLPNADHENRNLLLEESQLIGVQLGFFEESVLQLNFKLFGKDYKLSRDKPHIDLALKFPTDQEIKMPYKLNNVDGLMEAGILQNITMNKKVAPGKNYIIKVNIRKYNKYHTIILDFEEN